MIHLTADIGSVNHQRAGSARVFGGAQLIPLVLAYDPGSKGSGILSIANQSPQNVLALFR
jgi:hypothetical protein